MRCPPPLAAVGVLCALATASLSAQELHCRPCWHGFGRVQIGNSSSFSIELTNIGYKSLKITSDSVQGSAFSIGTFHLPVKLNPGASVQLPIIFTPTVQGHTRGIITLQSTAEDRQLTIDVGGNGVEGSSHSVYLSWQPGDDQAVGFNVYRGTTDGGPYQKINPSLDPTTSYTDYTVQSGMTYYYVATEVNAQGEESAYSNVGEAQIPQ